MKTWTYVEEYLEIISGYRDIVTNLTHGYFLEFKPIVNLARYDVRPLETMTNSVVMGQALTERQGELLCKIILTYQRQLSNKGIDVEPLRNPQWRVPLRQMDYTCRLYLQDDVIHVRFPFKPGMVDEIKSFAKESQGRAEWSFADRVWQVALTEYNLSWLHAWASVNKFEIDPAIAELMGLITDLERTNYGIELQVVNGVPVIVNAESSLIDYINEHLGGFDLDNLIRLVDYSSILGYTIGSSVAEVLMSEYGTVFYRLLSNREVKVNPVSFQNTDNFATILDYADATQRWPVVFFEPDLSGRMLSQIKSKYGTDYDQDRYIYTTRVRYDIGYIPLLISSAGMIFGGDKQRMLQRAEKVVYCSQDVYNKKRQVKVTEI